MMNRTPIKRRSRTRRSQTEAPTLRFSPYAWAKLLFLRDFGPTEVGGFGISAEDDLFLVEDFRLVQQHCTPVTVEFDDAAVADVFDEQADLGRKPEQFARLWIHTHPWESATPSGTDEATFARVFGRCDWAVMFIVSRTSRVYSRLRFTAGPGASQRIRTRLDYTRSFPATDWDAWKQEYQACVRKDAASWSLEDEALVYGDPAPEEAWWPPNATDHPTETVASELEPATGDCTIHRKEQ